MTDIPAAPAEPAPLTCDTAAIRLYAADLRAASAQLDDFGGFCSGSARIAAWVGGDADAYHAGLPGIGRRADALSLGLRAVSQRVEVHADRLDALARRRGHLVEEQLDLVRAVNGLRLSLPNAATPDQQQALLQDAGRLRGEITAYLDRVRAWEGDVKAEEQAMVTAFARHRDDDVVEDRYEGRQDPADAALATLPRDGTPEENRAWWDGLTREQQLAILAASPGSIGNLDGLPASVRHEANETSLQRDIAALEQRDAEGDLTDEEQRWLENAQAAEDALENTRANPDPVTLEPTVAQLYIYDPTAFDYDGRVAVVNGDLDTAENLSVSVPGLTNDARSITSNDALNLYNATRAMHPGETTATMLWIGYDAPSGADPNFARVGFEGLATDGGHRLADTLDGISVLRDDDPHTTVIGHSYGSTTVAHALSDHEVDVDDAILVGSPGAGGGVDHASDLDVPDGHLFVGAASDDPVADLGDKGWVNKGNLFGAGLGNDPAEDDFGATRFEAEDEDRSSNDYPDIPGVIDPVDVLEFNNLLNSIDQHTSYYDPDSESLYNMSQIVTGHTSDDDIMNADPKYDPWYAGAQDPEADAEVDAPSTDREVTS